MNVYIFYVYSIHIIEEKSREKYQHKGVSKNNGTPKSSHFNRVWNHYKPSILGAHPYFWKHPYLAHKQRFASLSTVLGIESTHLAT